MLKLEADKEKKLIWFWISVLALCIVIDAIAEAPKLIFGMITLVGLCFGLLYLINGNV